MPTKEVNKSNIYTRWRLNATLLGSNASSKPRPRMWECAPIHKRGMNMLISNTFGKWELIFIFIKWCLSAELSGSKCKYGFLPILSIRVMSRTSGTFVVAISNITETVSHYKKYYLTAFSLSLSLEKKTLLSEVKEGLWDKVITPIQIFLLYFVHNTKIPPYLLLQWVTLSKKASKTWKALCLVQLVADCTWYQATTRSEEGFWFNSAEK